MQKPLLPFLLVALCSAEMHLSGEISSADIDSSGNPYIIEQEIVVPAGRQVVIKEGCVFLFKSYTGLKVLGKLFVRGTPQHNVVFTSFNDTAYCKAGDQTARSFDWNGITIAAVADTVCLEHFSLCFSTYGIKAQNGKVSMRCGLFHDNGMYNFMIDDRMLDVRENIPYSFNVSSEEKADTVPVVVPEPPKPPRHVVRNILRYTSLSIGAAGLGAGAYYAIKAYRTGKNRDDREYVKQRAIEQQKPTSEVWEGLNADYEDESFLRNVFLGVGGAGVLGFTLTFVF